MSVTTTRMPIKRPRRTLLTTDATGLVAARHLTVDIERLRAEEQARIDREQQAIVARLQELARFD